MKSRFRVLLLVVTALASATTGRSEVTIDFPFDPELTGGVEKFVFGGSIRLEFTVSPTGMVLMDASVGSGTVETPSFNAMANAIVNSWEPEFGIVGSVDPIFAGEEFRIQLLRGPEPTETYEGQYVFENVNGVTSLGMIVADNTEIQQIVLDEGSSSVAEPLIEDYLLGLAENDVILNRLSGPGLPGNTSEEIFIGVDQSDFAFDSTSFHLTGYSYANASDPLTTDPHLKVSDIGGTNTKQDLSASPAGTVDISGEKLWTNNLLSFFGGYEQLWIGTETPDEDPTATPADGAGITGISFDLVPFYEGDINRDLVLDQADIDAFAAGWQSDTTGMDYYDALLLGDINYDLVVDWQDWYRMRQSFLDAGVSVPESFLASIPEPSAAALVAIALGLAFRSRRG